MSLIAKWYGNYALKKALAKERAGKHLPIASIKKACILISFGPKAEDESRALRKLLKQFKPDLEVDIFAYKSKTSPKEGPFTNFHILTKQDLNWYQRPINMRVGSVDWLIDLTDKKEIPLMFIGAMSNAPMKTGLERDYNSPYLQLMIKPKETYSLVYALEQLIHYIKMIKTKEHAA
ncbi:MAG: hypothetical protein KDC83_13810 [Flavobacteriales bacterium]|nr:hypothetical protein [Flavobacteriales bacterium]